MNQTKHNLKVNRSHIRIALISLGLSVCFGLFQNATLDERFAEMRKIQESNDQYRKSNSSIPQTITARDPLALGKAILDHNFASQFQEYESSLEKYTSWTNGSTALNSDLSGSGMGARTSGSYKLKAGILGSSNVGVQLSGDYKLRCLYSAEDHNIEVAFDRPLSPHTHLSVKIKGEGEQSSVGLTYRW